MFFFFMVQFFRKTLSTKLDSAQTDAEEKGAELTAGEITIIRLQVPSFFKLKISHF